MNKTFFTELTQSELQTTNGGLAPLAWFALGLIFGNLDSFVEGFKDGNSK